LTIIYYLKNLISVLEKGEDVPIYSLVFDLSSRSGRVSRTRRNRLKRILKIFPENLFFSLTNYLIFSEKNIDEIDAEIQKILDKSDKVIISEFTKNYCGSMPHHDWDWIDEHLK